ncbi:MAG: nucleotidyltransferase domain-containing protein [Propionibacteriaceae bacterium]|jgi:predicted nucleotidyltransferase|nr:nucleotidyltransferase domain-containing protein [Propionibacteriaceae bacterium]
MFFGQPFGGIIPGVHGAALTALLRTGEPLTGRQIHRLLGGNHSLWSVQQALKSLVKLGLVAAKPVGRAVVHSVNEEHCAIRPLREMLDPLTMLAQAVRQEVDDRVKAVLVFGSIATGKADADSDVDLAVIAEAGWDGRSSLNAAVQRRLGNACDVLFFTQDEFRALAAKGEPVVSDIMSDSFAIIGEKPVLKGDSR